MIQCLLAQLNKEFYLEGKHVVYALFNYQLNQSQTDTDAAVAKQTYYRECDRYFRLNFLVVRQAVCDDNKTNE